MPTTDKTRDRMPFRVLRLFFALTFILGWGMGVLMVVFTDQIEAIVGAIIVLLNRKTMLSREGAVTEVLMPGEEARQTEVGSVVLS